MSGASTWRFRRSWINLQSASYSASILRGFSRVEEKADVGTCHRLLIIGSIACFAPRSIRCTPANVGRATVHHLNTHHAKWQQQQQQQQQHLPRFLPIQLQACCIFAETYNTTGVNQYTCDVIYADIIISCHVTENKNEIKDNASMLVEFEPTNQSINQSINQSTFVKRHISRTNRRRKI